MTGHDLWVTTATVPMIAHYDLYHDKVTRTTSTLYVPALDPEPYDPDEDEH